MFDEKSYSLKMDKAIEVFSKELSSLRTGRANASMLDLIKVDVYGQQMPINQVGSITTPEPRMINIQVWDINNVPLIDAAIKKSDLGLNPQIDGQLIRLPVPELNEERRTELKKLIKSIGEKCKVSIRNIRREANSINFFAANIISLLFFILAPVKISASGIFGVINDTFLSNFFFITFIAWSVINLEPPFAIITGSKIIFFIFILFRDL